MGAFAREPVLWLLPQTLVGDGRLAELAFGRAAAVTLAALFAAAGFARFKLGREGAAATVFPLAREAALWLALLPHVLVGVGRAVELALEREAALGFPAWFPAIAVFPRLRLGLDGALAVESEGAREAGLWPPPLLPEVIGFAVSGLGRAAVLPPLELPREAGRWLPLPVGFPRPWFSV